MFWIDFELIEKLKSQMIDNIYLNIENYWPKAVWALIIIILWFIIARFSYTFTLYIFKKYNLKKKIDKVEDFLELDEEIKEWEEHIIKKKLTERIKVDVVAAKSVSYYLFLVFFRWAVIFIWIKDVEDSLDKLLNYLPSLFVWIVIWFFWIRFANFVYDLTYHTLSIAESDENAKTSKIIATWSKIIILFFTFMLVLNYTQIVDDFIIKTVLVWFISMLAMAWWLAFWLGWKNIAKEILEGFRK